MFHTTEPDLATDMRAFLERVVELVSKGYYSYEVWLGPDVGMRAYESEVKNWVEAMKQRTATTHPAEGFQYLCLDRYCLLMATPGLNDVLAHSRVRLEDIRKNPLPCIGYKISCEKLAAGYAVLVDGMSGKRLNVFRRFIPGSSEQFS